MPWKSQLAWTRDYRTTHNGTTYTLDAHSWQRSNGNWSQTDHWHLHLIPVGGDGTPDPRPVHRPLGTNSRRARRLAELLLLGWTPAQAKDREPGTGRDRWRSPDGDLVALADLLDGTASH
ncbi:hypothetical protein ACFWG6_31050 [Streptomyces erythrochromogenes]|uniref:hypothetical protein n=1 Tax=Streptomyces erythrochromogenes TaxID=285574 RepID=UPI003645719E